MSNLRPTRTVLTGQLPPLDDLVSCAAKSVLAVRALKDVVSCFKTDGSFECINEGYEKLPLFVVSATNVCGGFERTISDFPEFGAGKID